MVSPPRASRYSEDHDAACGAVREKGSNGEAGEKSVSAPSRLSLEYNRRGNNRLLVGVGEWEYEKQQQREWQEW